MEQEYADRNHGPAAKCRGAWSGPDTPQGDSKVDILTVHSETRILASECHNQMTNKLVSLFREEIWRPEIVLQGD
jgi:hypothetical protein